MRCPSCEHDNRDGARFCDGCGGALAPQCAQCGADLRPSARFCDACGQATGANTAAATHTPAPSPALPASFASGRYVVKGFLGEGGRKRVYLAHDEKLDRDVAFAVIKTEGLDADGLVRVRREAQAMGRLGDHPHIVTVFDTGDEGGQPFIVSQYMAGGAVEDLLRDAAGHRLPADQTMRIGEQVCRALEHAHSRGIVHRDLKPGNVWLTSDGTAQLGDFGLAVALDRSRLTLAGSMVGTAAYMPPEQALGGEADRRSDLYSLGCILYEMVTGRPPFLGDDTLGIISQHVNTPPLALSWHNPEVAPGLDALVLRLLAKAPEDRPASVSEVLAALTTIAAAPLEPAAPADSGPAPTRPGGPVLLRTRFVGRDKELAQVKAGLEAALSGRGSLVMVVGEPGIGKTRLSEELSVYARLRGAQVMFGQCYESEGAPPYIPFVEALRQYVAIRPPEALREEMGEGASDVAKLVSEVRAALPDIPHSKSQEPESERYRLLEGVTSFIVNASRANPLLLVLDDIHWADKPSLLLLQHLARRLSGSRILVVGTYRDIELDRRHPLSEVVAELRRERLYHRILLRGLDADGVHAMLESRAEHDVPRPFADVLHQQTEGNPFFLEEIVLNLLEAGAIQRVEGRFVGDPSLIQENIPEGVREVIGRRLSRLGEATNEALTFASVLGREFDFDVLQALTGMDEETLLASLEEALRVQLVEERRGPGGAAYRFSHALVRETLYGELSLARKQRFHLRAGEAIEKAHAGHLEPHIGHMARHFYEGNDPVKAIDYSRRAGEGALRVYAWEEAIRHWETALELMEEQADNDEDRAAFLERLGDVTYISGVDSGKAHALLEKALVVYEKLGARGKMAAMHSRIARNMVTFPDQLDLENAAAHFEAARAILEQDAPNTQHLAYVYIGLAQSCLYRLATSEGMGWARSALEIGEKLGSRAVIANAEHFVGWYSIASGELRKGFELMDSAWRVADEDGLTFIAFMGAGFGGPHHLFTRRDPRTARQWLQRELDKPRMASARALRPYLLGFLCPAQIMLGEMDGARDTAAGLEASQAPVSLQIARGDWEAAASHMQRILEAAESAGVIFRVSGVSSSLGELALRVGDYDRAEEHLRTSIGCGDKLHSPAFRLNTRATLVLALAKMSRLQEAVEELALCSAVLASGEDWGGTAGCVALARGTVLSAEGKWEEAETAFKEALAIAHQYGLPWDEADAMHEQALMHLARNDNNDRREALRLLDETIAIYQRLGAKRHIELVLADKLKVQGVFSSDIQTSIEAVAASAQAEQPDLKAHAAPDGTVTIMFSDIEGSTVLTERLGDKAWMAVLKEHNAIVRQQVKAHGGFEVKSEGDGFMVAFGSARRALDCAIEIQRALGERNAIPGDDAETPQPIRVRMGLHTGEAIKEGEDFFGKNVILAARIAAQATGGEILVSGLLKALVDSAGDIAFADRREVELKGLTGTHEIWPVGWGAA